MKPMVKAILGNVGRGLAVSWLPIGIGSSIVSRALVRKTFSEPKTHVDVEEAKNIVKENLPDTEIEIREKLKNNAFLDATAAKKKPDKVILPGQGKPPAAVLYHEIGHGKDFSTDRKKKINAYEAGMVGIKMGYSAPIMAQIFRLMKPSAVSAGMIPATALGSGVAAAIGGIPVVRAETRASENAIKMMKEKGYSKEDIAEAEKALERAKATYKITAVTPLLAGAASAAGYLLKKKMGVKPGPLARLESRIIEKIRPFVNNVLKMES